MDELIRKAIDFAVSKHEKQLDDSGYDYFEEHIFKVAKGVSVFTSDPEVIASAMLHDTLEDTDTTREELIEYFGENVAGLVQEVTKSGHNTFSNLHSRDAILIKLIDRASNVSRMDPWTNKRKEKYLEESRFWNR